MIEVSVEKTEISGNIWKFIVRSPTRFAVFKLDLNFTVVGKGPFDFHGFNSELLSIGRDTSSKNPFPKVLELPPETSQETIDKMLAILGDKNDS